MVLAMLQKIERYLSINLVVWLLYIKIILKIILNLKVFNNDLLLGRVYTLPENSLYSSINAFLDIENELVNFIEKDMKYALGHRL